MSEHTFSEANVLALWQNRAITTQHSMPNREELDAFLEKREHPKFPAVPEHMAMLDLQGYVFVLDQPKTDALEATQWGWVMGVRGPSGFPTLEAAVKNAYWIHIGLYGRIREVQKAGIKVEPASLGEGVHYWRFEQGNRVSALFPTEEAAWRDAIRVHENAVEKVKANFGMHRLPRRSAEESRELSSLKRMTEQAGFEYKGRRGQHFWTHADKISAEFDTLAEAVLNALGGWAEDDPEEFAEKMNRRSQPGTSGAVYTLGWQRMKAGLETKGYSFTETSWSKKSGAMNMLDGGLEAVVLDAWRHYLGVHPVLQSAEDCEAVSYMTHKSSGLTEPDEKHLFGMQKALEHDGYGFDFTASRGWIWSCDGEQGQGSDAKATAVKDAWKHAIAKGSVEKDLASVALGYARDYITEPTVEYVSPPCQHHAGFPDIAEPERGPKPGTRVMVRPHNAVWGFPNVDPVLCDIRGYWGEWVWLQRVGHFCSNDAFVTTRIDKCDIELVE